MLLVKLAIRNAFRHRLRSLLTILGVMVAILAFGLLRTVIDAWYSGVESSSANRLVTRNAISMTFSLPLAYREKIRAVPGVTQVCPGNWFGGIYIDEKNFFANFAYEPQTLLELYPEFVIDDAGQKADFLKDRKGCLVGAKLAKRFGWKVGDSVTLRGTIFPGDWSMTVRAIYRGGRANTDETQFFFHWAYLDETMRVNYPQRAGQVGFYLVGIKEADKAADISRAVDAQFVNSLAETLTETEKSFQMSFVSMSEAIILAIRLVSVVVVLIILAVAANTMAMSARERTGEYAVLKTLGFRASTVAVLIAGEALVISLSGAALGLVLIGPCASAFGTFMTDFFPVFAVSDETILWGMLAGLAVGVLSGIYPAWYAARVRIAVALRKVG
ncbi:MAG: ABC transporter permease [Desulfovibrio sp.]|nr:ABC transporter permease [Desulfovibrio sp.]MBI4959197.1 ABC transporter permease [Desulfovibrio sp.]